MCYERQISYLNLNISESHIENVVQIRRFVFARCWRFFSLLVRFSSVVHTLPSCSLTLSFFLTRLYRVFSACCVHYIVNPNALIFRIEHLFNIIYWLYRTQPVLLLNSKANMCFRMSLFALCWFWCVCRVSCSLTRWSDFLMREFQANKSNDEPRTQKVWLLIFQPV